MYVRGGDLEEGCIDGVRVRQIPRELYPAIADRAAEFMPLTDRGYRKDIAVYLRKSYGKRKQAKSETAPLFALCPIRPSRAVPVEAGSDAEAVFELLYQVTRSEGSDA